MTSMLHLLARALTLLVGLSFATFGCFAFSWTLDGPPLDLESLAGLAVAAIFVICGTTFAYIALFTPWPTFKKFLLDALYSIDFP